MLDLLCQPCGLQCCKLPTVATCIATRYSTLYRFSQAAVIIPCNATVGRSGSVLITYKSPSSVPPYRIENRTKAVRLMLRQQLEQPAGPRMAGAEGGPGRGNAAGSVAAAAAVLTGAVSPAKKEMHSPR